MSDQVERIVAAINARRAIYKMKMDRADALAENDGNKHDRMEHTMEAFDNLLYDVKVITESPTK